MPALIPWTPPEFEDKILALVELCLMRRSAGATVVVAGDWAYESALFQLLAVVGARLRRKGLTVAFCGAQYCSSVTPSRPSADVAVLLEAASYPNLAEWLARRPGQTVLLVGPVADWQSRGDLPVDFLAQGSDESFPERAVQHVSHIRDVWECGDNQVRSALLLNALGCDVPRGFPLGSRETLFVPAGGTDLITFPGQWLAWQALAPFSELLNQLWETEPVRLLPATLRERAAYRLALRRTGNSGALASLAEGRSSGSAGNDGTKDK